MPNIDITHTYHLTGMANMSCFLLDVFSYNDTPEFDLYADRLPLVVERKFIRDYKEWLVNGQPLGCDRAHPVPVPSSNSRSETRNPIQGAAFGGVASAAMPKPSPSSRVTGAAGQTAGHGTGLPLDHPPITTLNLQEDDFVVHNGPLHPALDFNKDICASDTVAVPGGWITPNPQKRVCLLRRHDG